MAICNFCKRKIKELPFHCHRCSKIYCSKHHLPEDHHCLGLEREKSKNQESIKKAFNRELKDIVKKGEQGYYVPNYNLAKAKEYLNNKKA